MKGDSTSLRGVKGRSLSGRPFDQLHIKMRHCEE